MIGRSPHALPGKAWRAAAIQPRAAVQSSGVIERKLVVNSSASEEANGFVIWIRNQRGVWCFYWRRLLLPLPLVRGTWGALFIPSILHVPAERGISPQAHVFLKRLMTCCQWLGEKMLLSIDLLSARPKSWQNEVPVLSIRLNTMKFHEIPWNSMKFHKILWNPICVSSQNITS